MGARSGFDADQEFGELLNVIDRGSGAVSAAQRQANALNNLGLLPTPGSGNVVIPTLGVPAASSVVTLDASGNLTLPGTLIMSGGGAVEGAGATKTLAAADGGKTILLNTAAGSVVTLPAATGSGIKYKFLVSVLATSNSHIVYTSSANGVGGTANVFVGLIFGTRVDTGNAVLGFAAQSTSNTVTLNRSTTGSVTLGEEFSIQDIAANTWSVDGMLSATGAAFATPFSHT